jgi:hypothetical protein
LSITTGTQNYGNVSLSGGFQAGHFDDVWDLTAGDMTVSFTYDGNGLVDDAGAHAWAELGVRTLGSLDFNPYASYADLIASQNADAGDVIVWPEGNNLYVKFIVTKNGCALTETHLAVVGSLDDIPQKNDNPIPGQFPFKGEYNPPVNEYTYAIPISWNAGTTLYIAAHAAVACGDQYQSAWGGDSNFLRVPQVQESGWPQTTNILQIPSILTCRRH